MHGIPDDLDHLSPTGRKEYAAHLVCAKPDSGMWAVDKSPSYLDDLSVAAKAHTIMPSAKVSTHSHLLVYICLDVSLPYVVLIRYCLDSKFTCYPATLAGVGGALRSGRAFLEGIFPQASIQPEIRANVLFLDRECVPCTPSF
jgi:hypothetical protein